MKEKDKIYSFFQSNQKQIYVDSNDLEMHLLKQKGETINNVTLALLHEYMDNQLEALKIWFQLNSEEGCERTVNILKKIGKADIIKKYSKWVLEANPRIGLELFEETVKIG